MSSRDKRLPTTYTLWSRNSCTAEKNGYVPNLRLLGIDAVETVEWLVLFQTNPQACNNLSVQVYVLDGFQEIPWIIRDWAYTWNDNLTLENNKMGTEEHLVQNTRCQVEQTNWVEPYFVLSYFQTQPFEWWNFTLKTNCVYQIRSNLLFIYGGLKKNVRMNTICYVLQEIVFPKKSPIVPGN